MIAFLLALGLVTSAMPNPHVTPGEVRPLTIQQICSTKWGLDRRAVTVAMKKRVAARYGVPWAERQRYEFDHLVPRSLGGADTETNLWPQRWLGRYNAHSKDRLEVRLSSEVCAGRLELSAAQQMIRTDWMGAYRRYFGEPR